MLVVFCLSLLAIAFSFLSWRFFFHHLENPNQPPSPPRLPIIGNLHQLGSLVHRSLHDLADKYGPLMLLQFGQVPVLVVSSAELVREIVKKHDVAFSGRPPGTFSEILVYNHKDLVLATYGEHWRQIRKISVTHLFSNKQVLSGRFVRREEVKVMLEKITTSIGKPINLSKMLMELTNDVTCRIALGKKYSKEAEVEELIDELMALIGMVNIGDYIPYLAWINKLNGLDSRVQNHAKKIDRLLELVLQDHRQQHPTSPSASTPNGQSSLVHVLLDLGSNSDGEFSLDDDSIKGIILDMFSAGTHTSYATMDWIMVELIRHPEKMKKVQEEVRRITSKKEMVEESDTGKMSYLKWVIKEALRLHPPLPLLVPHETIEDVELRGYRIPKKTKVLFNCWVIGRDPNIWERPEEFWPERFVGDAESDVKLGQDVKMMPFGAGRRICPGIAFSSQVMELALANLLYFFDWKLPEGVKVEDLDMSETSGISCNRKDSLVLVAMSP